MWTFLSGPMGSGKSTVAALVATRAGLPHYDLDARIEAAAGQSISEVFRSQGESTFRRLEAEQLRQLVRDETPGVVALGGGTVVDPASRRLCRQTGVLITLSAAPEQLAARVGQDPSRPLLADVDPTARLTQLLREREGAYRECHHYLRTDGLTPQEVSEEVFWVHEQRPEMVALGVRSYPIYVGVGTRRLLPPLVGHRCQAASLFWVTDEVVAPLWLESFQEPLSSARPLGVAELPAGESNKTLSAVDAIWEQAIAAGVDRRSVLVALGGGVVGDLATFAASTLYRGIRAIGLPTTLLAMVDSSVGGKTGFNRIEGKNLVGSFHQPEFVLCDIDVLGTLQDREYRAGLAEVVKSAWIAGEEQVLALERDAEALVRREPNAVERAVRMSIRLKAEVVEADERESGRRAVLNLGHTIGHALEKTQGYGTLLHGEAVSLGLVAALRVSEALGATGRASVERMSRLLERLGLPTGLDDLLTEDVFRAVAHDKKRDRDTIGFILTSEPGEVRVEPMSLDRLPSLVS